MYQTLLAGAGTSLQDLILLCDGAMGHSDWKRRIHKYEEQPENERRD